MAKVMQLYGMSVNEVLKLTDAHVMLMLDHAATTSEKLIASHPEFGRALGVQLAPVARTVRADIGSDEGPK